MLQSGTEGRRDGVSDKETYKALRSAMTTMHFQGKEQENIFSVTAVVELGNDQSELGVRPSSEYLVSTRMTRKQPVDGNT